MTVWGFLLALAGLALVVYGGNVTMMAKLGERPRRGGRVTSAGGRLAMRAGMALLAVGVGLFALGIIINTVVVVITLVAVALAILAVVGLWGRLRGR